MKDYLMKSIIVHFSEDGNILQFNILLAMSLDLQ